MDFGLLNSFRNPPRWAVPVQDIYREHIELAVLAEKLGFKELWTSEHHFAEDSWSPSQLPILAALAARTERIRLGTFILLMPLHNPVRIAEDVATVDIISNGRLDLGVGPGSGQNEFDTFGVPFKQRRPRMHEGLEIIRRCFDERASFDFAGKYWNFRDVNVMPKPVQKPLPLWVAAQGEVALAEAGTRGYHLAFAPSASDQRIYDDALRKAGHNPANFKRAGLKYMHLAETHEKAWDEAEAHLHYMLEFYYAMWTKQRSEKSHSKLNLAPLPAVGELRKGGGPGFARGAIIGTPEEAIKALEEIFKASPMTMMNLGFELPGMDPPVIRKSMELFAKEVMPHFKN